MENAESRKPHALPRKEVKGVIGGGKQSAPNVVKPSAMTTFNHMKRPLFQRIDENVFKLSEDKYSTEELQALWQEDEHGEYIQFADDGSARYIAHGKAMETIVPPTLERTRSSFVKGKVADIPMEPGQDADRNRLYKVNQWCSEKGFFPNIWYVNERGNIELVSKTGKFLGGLV